MAARICVQFALTHPLAIGGSLTGLEPASEEAVVREGFLPTDSGGGGLNRAQMLGAQRLGTGRWFPVRIAGTFRGRFRRTAAGGISVIPGAQRQGDIR